MNNEKKHDDNVNENVAMPADAAATSGQGNGDSTKKPTAASLPAPDPFEPKNLRLGSNFAATLGVKKAVLTVPVRKPAREWWIRVHPDSDYHLDTAVLELKEDREIYLVDPDLRSELSTEATFGPRAIFTAVNTVGVVFLWPIRLPGPDGKIDDWNRSALEAANMAKEKWIRIYANMSLGAYEVLTSANETAPAFPQLSFRDLLRIAFRDKYITTLDHPVIKKLRGLA